MIVLSRKDEGDFIMNDLTQFAVKKMLQGILLVVVVSFLLFLLMQLMPGDPISLLAGPRVSLERVEELREKWGLDKPVVMQYLYWAKNAVQLDFGTSLKHSLKVSDLIMSRLPCTLLLCGSALLLEILIAVPLGLIAACKKDSLLDRLFVLVTIVLNAIPSFWLAIILILLFSVKIALFPVSGYNGPSSMVLPVLTLLLPALAGTMRMTRSEVLEVFREKYIATAYAKGLKSQIVLFRHVLRNALIPIVVLVFLWLPWMIGGAIIVENIFALPGMGRLFWQSIYNQDFPVVQAIVLIIAILTAVCNTMGDIVTALLDPRIRMELKG